MRILMIHNRERKSGGESIAFDRESEALRSLGHELLLLQKQSREFELAHTWRKAWLTLSSIFNVRAYVALRRTVRSFRPDVAIIHNPFPLWSVAPYLALLAERIPIIHVVHNFRLRCLNGLYFRSGAPCTLCRDGKWWKGVRYKCVHNSVMRSIAYAVITQTIWPLGVVRRVAAFRVLSRFTRERLIEMGISSHRIHVIHNLSPRLDFVRHPALEPTWVYMGHLDTAKGPQVAVSALAQGAPGRLIIIGGGPLADELHRRVASERLRVELLGIRDGAERFEILRQAWALVLPSVCFENGPLAVLEALSLGVPVIASRIGSIPEYVIDGVTGRLFAPGDEVDLARVLRELANDPSQRERLSAGALEAYRQRFAASRVAGELDGLLQSTLSQSRANAR